MPSNQTNTIQSSHNQRLAYHFHDHNAASKPALVFCPGLRSDMQGTKALHLADWAQGAGYDYLRFDYSGHGESDGKFEDGTIGQWFADAGDVISTVLADRDIVLVGSSMGGWVGLLAATKMDCVKGLVLIAPAPDFTERLIMANLADADRKLLDTQGYLEEPSEYSDEPTIYTKALIDDGAKQRILTGQIAFDGPTRILHGMADADVPYGISLEIADQITTHDCQLLLVNKADHRFSSQEELALLSRAVGEVYASLSMS